MQPREHAISYLLQGPQGAFHRLAFTAWGDPHAEPVLCVHGLTRQGRDFDALAENLADRFYVICPDMPGRGRSSWLPEPMLYQNPTYVAALSHLLAFIDRPVRWVGTSMGGILGMLIAASPGNPILRMVLNDIGPTIPQAALERIQSYVGAQPRFADVDEAAAYLRRVHAPFGPLSDAQWLAMATHSVRPLGGGELALHFDPAMTVPILGSPAQEVDLWPVWKNITVPRLTIRGAESDLLLAETLQRMSPESRTFVVEGCGHAPALMDDASIAVIREFLMG